MPTNASRMAVAWQLEHCWQYCLFGMFHTLAGGLPTLNDVHVVFSVPAYLPNGSMTRTWNTGALVWESTSLCGRGGGGVQADQSCDAQRVVDGKSRANAPTHRYSSFIGMGPMPSIHWYLFTLTPFIEPLPTNLARQRNRPHP